MFGCVQRDRVFWSFTLPGSTIVQNGDKKHSVTARVFVFVFVFVSIFFVVLFLFAEDIVYPARPLRALGLLLADGAPTVGGGKTF